MIRHSLSDIMWKLKVPYALVLLALCLLGCPTTGDYGPTASNDGLDGSSRDEDPDAELVFPDLGPGGSHRTRGACCLVEYCVDYTTVDACATLEGDFLGDDTNCSACLPPERIAQLIARDSDNDGANDYEELLAGSDPFDANDGPDADGDGITNDEDEDIDGDGLLNGEDDDVDGDGILNGLDDDVDGDGIPNGDDRDIDGDGSPNGFDFDVDGDGLLNELDFDVDADGLLNTLDPDIDGDFLFNWEDDDDDGDGIPDIIDDDDDADGIVDLTTDEDDECHFHGECDDGDPCTEDSCVNGECDNADKLCDDRNECTDDECEKGKCKHENNTKSCDDGDDCTENDKCESGRCVGTPITCPEGQTCDTSSGECGPQDGDEGE